MIKTFKEHSSVPVPAWLQALGDDGSWGNDAMPHAFIWTDEATFRGVEIWINYDKAEDREIGTKWEVLLMVKEGQYHNQDGEVLYEGEDEAEAIKAVNRGLEKLESPLRVGSPIAGVWTLWADVLCRNCHDALGAEVTAKRELKWPVKGIAPEDEKREGDGQGICTQCGAAVWVHEEVARLTRLRALVGGEMQQTGGMCCALAIRREDKGTVIVTNMDNPITIGLWKPGVWEDGGEAVEYYSLPGCTPDEDAAAIIKAVVTESLEGR